MSNYEPGTVAVATVRGVPNVRAFRYREGSWVTSKPLDGTRVHHSKDVTDVRPLVVLDLDAPDFVARALRLAAAMIDNGRDGYQAAAQIIRSAADQIEAHTRPPKPAEPTGLGAVVEDAEGTSWIRNATDDDCKWRSDYGSWRTYADIDAVRIVAEGWSE